MTLHIPLGGNEATHHSTSVDVEAPTVSSMDPKYLGSVADKHDMKSLGRVQILLVGWPRRVLHC